MARITISESELEALVMDAVSDMQGFLDVVYPVDVQLGSASMSVSELVDLQIGDVVSLDRPSSGYVEIVVGDVKIGEAEVLIRKKGSAARIVEIS
jgi:flagellar motor switch/type III secretory pathway protein FliN